MANAISVRYFNVEVLTLSDRCCGSRLLHDSTQSLMSCIHTSASEVTTLWRYTNLFINIIIIIPEGVLFIIGLLRNHQFYTACFKK